MAPIIATHSGVFHADDVFACAVLGRIFPEAAFVRTRDPAVLESANFKIDVGGSYRPELGEYDHHQKGRAGGRANGVLYSSFGLVWKDYGTQYCGDNAELAELVDVEFVQAIDAIDNGQDITRPGMPGVRVMSVSGLFSQLNPCWHEEGSNFDHGFHAAVALAEVFLQRIVENVRGKMLAVNLLKAEVSRQKGPVLLLERFIPWNEWVRDNAPHVQLVVFPSEEGTWMVQGVNATRGTFDLRVGLPKAWAGLRNEQLAQVTGVQDSVFCHPGLFIAGAKSKDGALSLAALALYDAETRRDSVQSATTPSAR
jgi:uncharacterized UPF0160 family protein